MESLALRLTGVSIVRDGTTLLADVDWTVAADERWVVIGPNGSGKTTLLAIAGARLHPSRARSRSWGSGSVRRTGVR